jgi:hypothetical protein
MSYQQNTGFGLRQEMSAAPVLTVVAGYELHILDDSSVLVDSKNNRSFVDGRIISIQYNLRALKDSCKGKLSDCGYDVLGNISLLLGIPFGDLLELKSAERRYRENNGF